MTYTLGNLKFDLPGNSIYFEEDDSRGYYDGEDENWHVVRMLAYSMPDDEADYLEDDENVLIEEKFFENGKCRLYDLGGEEEEDNDEYVCQCQIITEHQFTLFTLSCEGKDEAMGFSANIIDHLTATKTNKQDNLLQQIEQWKADDEEQKKNAAILERRGLLSCRDFWRDHTIIRGIIMKPLNSFFQ